MKVGIATDHNGVEQKQELIYYLNDLGCEVIDYSKDNTPSDDYPDYAKRVADAIGREISLGILMCGTGIGMSIAANKIKGIRCAKVSSDEEAFLARQHNNANVIALSYKMPMEELKICIKRFVETPFSNEERHVRRVQKINDLEVPNPSRSTFSCPISVSSPDQLMPSFCCSSKIARISAAFFVRLIGSSPLIFCSFLVNRMISSMFSPP